jgi:5-methylcytosine-specific restriction endonuclease McrA
MLDCSIKDFSKIYRSISEFNCVIPDIQRMVDVDHANAIYEHQLSCFNKFGKYIISGCISIVICDNIEYLIDGQHRLVAYRRLINEFPDRPIEVMIDYYSVDKYADMEALYKNVNTFKENGITRMPLDPYKIVNKVQTYLQNNFKTFISTSDKPYRPHINVNKIAEYIIENKVLERASITSGEDFIARIRQLNSFYANISATQFAAWGIKNADTILRKIHESPTNLYFGLYTNYEWLERICDLKSYNELHHYCSTFRVPISKALRIKVWNSMMVAGNCYCCDSDITNVNFECGHIIPITLGGKTIADNLRAICRQCNADMGTRNLEEYKAMLNEQMKDF